ncbi:MAG: BcpO-related WXXGXW repeat protein [Kofleriaceae bacterium]|nr:BcpO-related WXXGXW repeat protein [Kofleriaceae bacterium]
MKSKLVSLLLAGAAAASVPALSACAGSGRAYVVADSGYDDAPPPLREEYVAVRPGFVWVHGNWERDRGRWHWRNGHYERERVGHVWRDGRWTRNGRNWVWVRGTWQPRGEIVIRGRVR